MDNNSRRREPNRCSSCGKLIALGCNPKLCERCRIKQIEFRKKRPPYVKKGRKPYQKLKCYKVPLDDWRLYLYTESRAIGIKALSGSIGIPYSSLLKYIFEKRKPIGTNKRLIAEFFRGHGKHELILEL